MKSLLISLVLACPFTSAFAESPAVTRSAPVGNATSSIDRPTNVLGLVMEGSRATEATASSPARALGSSVDDPFVRNAAIALIELNQAAAARSTARANWDAAVAGGHPNPAGVWARRHFAAMQRHLLAAQRYDTALEQLEAARGSR
ncbi:MAG: hypothetical protein AB7P03_15130 [Kofleriaceae bacterium]